jgi:hypothetical protein
MSVPSPVQRDRPADAVAGLMASAALFASLFALVYRPLRITPFTIAISLVAVGMSSRHQRLATIALFVSTACFAIGTTIAVVLKNPVF